MECVVLKLLNKTLVLIIFSTNLWKVFECLSFCVRFNKLFVKYIPFLLIFCSLFSFHPIKIFLWTDVWVFRAHFLAVKRNSHICLYFQDFLFILCQIFKCSLSKHEILLLHFALCKTQWFTCLVWQWGEKLVRLTIQFFLPISI